MERDERSVETVARAHAAQWAFFACGGREYAVRLDRVHEIVPPQPVTRIPGCGSEVYGLLGLRGRVITVFDFGVLAGGPASAGRPDHRLMLLRYGGTVVGLAVDQMLTITSSGDVDADETAPAGRGDGATGELKAGGRSFTVLDPDAVFGSRLA